MADQAPPAPDQAPPAPEYVPPTPEQLAIIAAQLATLRAVRPEACVLEKPVGHARKILMTVVLSDWPLDKDTMAALAGLPSWKGALDLTTCT